MILRVSILALSIICLYSSGLDSQVDSAGYYFNLAVEANKSANYDLAILHGMSALNHAQLNGDTAGLARIYNNLSFSHYYKANFTVSVFFARQQIRILESLNSSGLLDKATAYNTLGSSLLEIGALEDAIDTLRISRNYFIESGNKDHPDFATTNLNISKYFFLTEEIDSSIYYLSFPAETYREIYGDTSDQYASIINNQGALYFSKSDFWNAIKSFEKAQLVYELLGMHNSIPVGQLYNNLGSAYIRLGNARKGEAYFLKATAVFERHLPPDHPFLGDVFRNLSQSLLDLGLDDDAKGYALEAQRIFIQAGGQTERVAMTNNVIGKALANSKQSEEAIHFIETSIKQFESLDPTPYNLLSGAVNNLGVIIERMGQVDDAHFQYQKALSYAKQSDLPTNQILVRKQLIRYYLDQHNIGMARLHLDSVIMLVGSVLDFNFSNVKTPDNLLRLLSLASDVYVASHKESGNLAYLDTASLYQEAFFEYLKISRRSYQDAQSRYQLIETHLSIFEKAIEVAYLRYIKTGDASHAERAFEIAEMSKARLLFDAVKNAQAFKYAGIPQELLDAEQSLRTTIAYYQSLSDDDSGKFDERLFDLKRSYESLIQRFEKDFPEYYKLKYNVDPMTVEEVRSTLLDKDRGLIEYMVGEEAIYVILITWEKLLFEKITNDFDLYSTVSQIRHGIQSYFSAAEQSEALFLTTSEAFSEASVTLFERLFEPLTKTNLPNKLIIIPDGVLAYLPFDLLMSSQPQNLTAFGSHPYLIRDFEFNYSFSANLLREMSSNRITKGIRFLGFAPSFIHRSESGQRVDFFKPLQFSEAEVSQIGSIFSGRIAIGPEATKNLFLQECRNFPIIHLATHGKAIDSRGESSFIAFSNVSDSTNYILETSEIYNLEINARMVTLGACETGLGELRKGEGVIGLARSFAFAGAQSIIMSLWTLDDQVSSWISNSFYSNLKSGMSKPEALRQAKLAYLDGDTDHFSKHPFYWAGLNVIGDMSPVNSRNRFLIPALGLVFVLSLIFLLRKTRT